jgi:ketosteroid isomerase-like protein
MSKRKAAKARQLTALLQYIPDDTERLQPIVNGKTAIPKFFQSIFFPSFPFLSLK